MKGLQNKCLIASAFTHGLLLLLVVVGSAFISRKPKVEPASFELIAIPAMLVDEPNVVGGGNPNATPAPQTPAPATPAPEPPQTRVEPPPETKPPETKPPEIKPPEQVREPVKQPPPEPVKPEVRPKDPDAFNFNRVIQKAKPAPEKKPSSFDLSEAKKMTIKSTAEGKSSDNEKSDHPNREAQMARAGALSSAFERMRGGLSSVGSHELPGPGGAAYASYELALRKFYEDAWIPPQAGRGDEPVVQVEVVIAKDGSILSQKILKKSGRRTLDESVQQTLNRVGRAKAPAFPSGATDEKRSFRINFNLTDKLKFG